MRRFCRRVLPVALVAVMVGGVMAASSSTTTIQSTAKMVPVASAGKEMLLTATATAVYQDVTIVQNGTTFPSNKTMVITVKGLTNWNDNSQVFFDFAKKTISVQIQKGAGKAIADESTGFSPGTIKAGDLIVGVAGVDKPGSLNKKIVFAGNFGPLTTTTK